jgi:ribosomal-protein-alanine N-acetyltransferase
LYRTPLASRPSDRERWRRQAVESGDGLGARRQEEIAIDGLTIRPIGPGDAEQLGELFVALATGPEAGQFHPHPLTVEAARRVAGGAASRKDIYFAAFLGNRLVGYGMLRGWDEGYSIPSFGVAVAAAYRGRGVGRALLRYAIESARGRGAETMMLKVHVDNPGARNLYESEGFVFGPSPDDPGQVKGLLALGPTGP